ncbi:MAG: hypothetical protein EOP48_27565 [Sphingobacteriales bacterium]|nr:MAG: hypothetical protein EOP48_27565 [Sphingobacteriales bacterium]
MGQIILDYGHPGLWVDFDVMASLFARKVSRDKLMVILKRKGFLKRNNIPGDLFVETGQLKLMPASVNANGELEEAAIYFSENGLLHIKEIVDTCY